MGTCTAARSASPKRWTAFACAENPPENETGRPRIIFSTFSSSHILFISEYTDGEFSNVVLGNAILPSSSEIATPILLSP